MSFQPFISQLIPDQQHGYLLPNALTLAAFGLTDSQLRKYRPHLAEDKHYLYLPGQNKTKRLYYTLTGLVDLADLINSERSNSFKAELVAACKAITHQPRGYVIPTSQPAQQSEDADIEPSALELAPNYPLDYPVDPVRPQSPHYNPWGLIHDRIELERDRLELERMKLLKEGLLEAAAIRQPAVMPQQPVARIEQPPTSQTVEHNHYHFRDRSGDRGMFEALGGLATVVGLLFFGALVLTGLANLTSPRHVEYHYQR